MELQLRFGPRWPEGSRELKNRGPSDVFGAVAAGASYPGSQEKGPLGLV